VQTLKFSSIAYSHQLRQRSSTAILFFRLTKIGHNAWHICCKYVNYVDIYSTMKKESEEMNTYLYTIRATFISSNKFVKKLDSNIYLTILFFTININIFLYIFSQSCSSRSENDGLLGTEGVACRDYISQLYTCTYSLRIGKWSRFGHDLSQTLRI
jgi:hypothetical protein